MSVTLVVVINYQMYSLPQTQGVVQIKYVQLSIYESELMQGNDA